MGTGVSVFITAFFFIAGFVLGLVYKKIIQKRKIRQHVYTKVKEYQSKHFADMDIIKDIPLQLRNTNPDLSSVDDGVEEHSEKEFVIPKDFGNEPESFVVNDYTNKISDDLQENVEENPESNPESHFDGKPVKTIQTEEEQEILDKEMDANTLPVKNEIEKYINE